MSLETAHLDEFCKKLENLGWEQKEPQKLEDYLIKEIFDKKIEELNKKIFDSYPEEREKMLARIHLELQNADEVKILEFLRFGVPIIIKKWNTPIPLTFKLLDYKETSNNSFHYIREQEIKYGNKIDRPDILLFINGIPLILIEGKNPASMNIFNPYYEALKQIMRYQKEIRGLFRFVQFGVGVADRKPYIPTLPLEEIKEPKSYMFWKVNNKENILDMLNPQRILDIIENFIFFTKDKKGNRIKIMARYMQYSAVKKIMKRITNYLENKDTKQQGLIWHWQGSGKTNTMFFAAYQFLKKYGQRDPLVFFVVDRIELEEQMERTFKSIEHKKLGEVERIYSIERLQEIIENADKMWGLKIVTMQKFQESKLDINKIVDKKEILFLIDEAHRTQYGDLGSTLRKIFRKGMYIGFTGTPVFTNERNTFRFFAYPPEELYLDEYFIEQSQQDGFTLPLTFKIVEEKKDKIEGIKILLSEKDIKDLLEELEKNEEEVERIFQEGDASKLKKQLKEKIRKKKVILENIKRIEKVVEYIHKSIEEDTENWTFKAMIVASSRTACVRYKKILDKHFPSEWSEVVMSYQPNEESNELHGFKEKFLKKYNTYNESEANKKVRENFLEKENPRILIVTDMLLTGFDAPILKVMYLDKIMYFHRLLQAVARVNRPYPEKGKREGLIKDSVGIVSHIYKTLNTYKYLAKENPEKIKQDLKNVFKPIEKEIEHLKDNIDLLKSKLREEGIDLEEITNQIKNNKLDFWEDLESKLANLALKKDDEKTIKLFRFIKETLEIYKSLGANPEKIEYKKYINSLSLIYRKFIKTIRRGSSTKYKDALDILINWINENTVVEEMEEKFEKKISKIRSKKPEIKESAATFYEIKNKTMEKLHNPLYKEIYERIEALRKQWINRNIEIEQFFKELEKEKGKLKTLEDIEKEDLDKRIHKLILEYLKKENLQEIDIKEIENKVNEILKTGRMLDSQERDIKIIVAKTIFNSKIENNRKKEIIENLNNIIINAIRGEYEK